MNNIGIKTFVVSAVIVGLVIGIGTALARNGVSNDVGIDAAQISSSTEFDPKNLPAEVLKALPPEELAELFPEKADAILALEAFEALEFGSNVLIEKPMALNVEECDAIIAAAEQNDPEYLRAVIQKLGGEAPEGASTKELQDILASLSASAKPSDK